MALPAGGTGDYPGGKTPATPLSHKYLGEDPLAEPDEVTRLIVRVIPERINTFRV